jgi:hypothetical protein
LQPVEAQLVACLAQLSALASQVESALALVQMFGRSPALAAAPRTPMREHAPPRDTRPIVFGTVSDSLTRSAPPPSTSPDAPQVPPPGAGDLSPPPDVNNLLARLDPGAGDRSEPR